MLFTGPCARYPLRFFLACIVAPCHCLDVLSAYLFIKTYGPMTYAGEHWRQKSPFTFLHSSDDSDLIHIFSRFCSSLLFTSRFQCYLYLRF